MVHPTPKAIRSKRDMCRMGASVGCGRCSWLVSCLVDSPVSMMEMAEYRDGGSSDRCACCRTSWRGLRWKADVMNLFIVLLFLWFVCRFVCSIYRLVCAQPKIVGSDYFSH